MELLDLCTVRSGPVHESFISSAATRCTELKAKYRELSDLNALIRDVVSDQPPQCKCVVNTKRHFIFTCDANIFRGRTTNIQSCLVPCTNILCLLREC